MPGCLLFRGLTILSKTLKEFGSPARAEKAAGKLGREEPDEIQQGQVPGPAPGEEQPHAPVQARGGPAGEQLCGEGPGSAGEQQVDHDPAVCPGCQEGQWDPGMQWPAGRRRFSFPSTLP